MVAQERNIVIFQRVHMHGLKAWSEQTHLFKQLNAIAAMTFFTAVHEPNFGGVTPDHEIQLKGVCGDFDQGCMIDF